MTRLRRHALVLLLASVVAVPVAAADPLGVFAPVPVVSAQDSDEAVTFHWDYYEEQMNQQYDCSGGCQVSVSDTGVVYPDDNSVPNPPSEEQWASSGEG